VHHPHFSQRSPSRHTVEITVLGGFRVTIDGVSTNSRGWSRRSAAALVKILALAPGHRLHRESVMDLLWPDAFPEQAAPRLHKAAHYARRAAGHEDAVVLRGDVVWLFPNAEVSVDAVRFEDLSRQAVSEQDPQRAREALAWYTGELLPADRYEDWASERRELLALRRLDVLRVAGAWRDIAEEEPTDEEAHTRLMEQQLAAGDFTAALRQYEHLERVLDRELGVVPGPSAREVGSEAARGHAAHQGRARASLVAELNTLAHRQRELLAELAALTRPTPCVAC